MKKQSNAFGFIFGAVSCLLLVVCLISCGQQTNSGDSSTTNYTLSGKVGTVTSQGLSASAAQTVTHIVAISASNKKYVASLEADGTFSLAVKTGTPFAVGFYNKTGSTITLLGYLRQNQVNWDSLPLINPSTSSTNLGTVEINSGSKEAVPSIALNDLLSSVNMTNATANIYGDNDDLMTRFTNVDVDGNGEFDFLENKAYLLDVLVQIGKSNGLTSGEVSLMLNKYYDNYYAVPHSYQFPVGAAEGSNGTDKPANGTSVTLKFPQAVTDQFGNTKTSINGTVGGTAGNYGWGVISYEAYSALSTFSSPAIVPSGTYTLEVTGRANYTFKNIKGSPAVAVGLSENILYPVLKLSTNEAGYFSTIDYKWMIRQSGVTREATAAEVKAIIADSDVSSDNFVQTSPTIGVDANDNVYRAPKKIALDAGSLDISTWNLKQSMINKFGVSYSLNTNVDCRFYFIN